MQKVVRVELAASSEIVHWCNGVPVKDDTAIHVEGKIYSIKIRRDGDLQVEFTITEDGSVIITAHQKAFEMHVPSSLILRNTRPWKGK